MWMGGLLRLKFLGMTNGIIARKRHQNNFFDRRVKYLKNIDICWLTCCADLHHRCYIHLKIIWFITSLASVKILHMWYTERAIMASSCFFVCDLPLGHAVHAPHGSAVAVDAAFGWRINPWWGRSTWRGASSFQFHIAGLRVFWSHSRSSLL